MIKQEQISQAKIGIVPEGVALAVTGCEGGEQALYREGDDVVCYWQGYVGDDINITRRETRRTPITPAVAEKLCASFLARNNA